MKKLKSLLGSAAAAGSLVLLAACGSSGSQTDDAREVNGFKDMDALVAAAKKEGQMVLYSSQVDSINNAWAKAFEAKYGVTVQVNRMQGAEVGTRYQAEASAGKVLADVIMPSCTEKQLFSELATKGWTTSAEDLGLPSLSGDGASNLRADGDAFMSAVLSVVIGYNTNEVTKADLPADWDDLLDPK